MKSFPKICAALLVAAMLLPLAGCATAPVALSYGDSVITTNMYRYFLSSYKRTFLYTYTDMSDTDAFWDSVLYDDITAEDYLNATAIENMKRTLICAELCDRYGLSLSESDLADIDLYIADLTEEYGDGSKQRLNQMLAEFGINADMLREIYIMEDKASLLYQYLYSDGGPNALTEEQLDSFYRENYARVRHIWVNDAYAYATNDAGYQQYDANGNAVTRALTEAELAEKNAKIAAIEQALANGDPFDTVYETYSEDRYYVNGYYLTEGTTFIDEVVEAAFTLEIGAYTSFKTDFGMHYVMRLPLEDYAYNDTNNADFFDGFEDAVANDDFLAFLEEKLAEVTVHTEETELYSIRDAAVNYAI